MVWKWAIFKFGGQGNIYANPQRPLNLKPSYLYPDLDATKTISVSSCGIG